jgi:hypothetical protein
LSFLLHTWQANRDTIVGISPRLHAFSPLSGNLTYLNWQYTWWNGQYSIVLTKASIFHKKYLYAYDKIIPPSLSSFIDKNKNCEDIAIQYVITKLSSLPPVWTSVLFYDVGTKGGISSKVNTHFSKR